MISENRKLLELTKCLNAIFVVREMNILFWVGTDTLFYYLLRARLSECRWYDDTAVYNNNKKVISIYQFFLEIGVSEQLCLLAIVSTVKRLNFFFIASVSGGSVATSAK